MRGGGGGGCQKSFTLGQGGGGSQKFHPYLGGGGQKSFWTSNVDLPAPPPPRYINNEHSLRWNGNYKPRP